MGKARDVNPAVCAEAVVPDPSLWQLVLGTLGRGAGGGTKVEHDGGLSRAASGPREPRHRVRLESGGNGGLDPMPARSAAGGGRASVVEASVSRDRENQDGRKRGQVFVARSLRASDGEDRDFSTAALMGRGPRGKGARGVTQSLAPRVGLGGRVRGSLLARRRAKTGASKRAGIPGAVPAGADHQLRGRARPMKGKKLARLA